MPPVVYAKPFLNGQDLVAELICKGLRVDSVADAEAILNRMNYYRFKAYLRPFLNVGTKRYNATAEFNDGLQLYRFDAEFREWVFSIIARLEVKLRSRLDQVVTEHTGNPFWYLDNTLFRGTDHLGVQSKLNASFQKSTYEFVLHYKANYINNASAAYPHLPPFWMAAELSTFGQIRILYQTLIKTRFGTLPTPNKLDDLANQFGARNIKDMNSWMTCLRDIRNRCAHHSRLWNTICRQPAGMPGIVAIAPTHLNRIYLTLVVLQVMSKNIGLDTTIRDDLQNLLGDYPLAHRFASSMGIPTDWHTDPVWT